MNKIESVLNLIIPEQSISQEEIDRVLNSVQNPPQSAIEYAQATLDIYNELPLPEENTDCEENEITTTPSQQALTSLIQGGNVPATIALAHIEEYDTLTKFQLGLQAFEYHINLLNGDDDEIFRDLKGAKSAQRDFTVFRRAQEEFVKEQEIGEEQKRDIFESFPFLAPSFGADHD